MILLVAVILFALFIAPLVLECQRSGRPRDLFSPLRLMCCLHLLTVVPFLFMVGFDENTFPQYARRNLQRLDVAILHYAAVQAVAFLALWAGIAARLPWTLVRRLPAVGVSPKPGSLLRAGVIVFVIGFTAYLIYVSRIGGFSGLIHTNKPRNVLMAGNGYLLALTRLILPGVMAFICSLRYRRSPTRIFFTVLAMASAIAALSSMGGRLSAIMLVVVSVLTWHYTVRRIIGIPLWAYTLILLFVPYFVAMPLLREPGAALRYSRQHERLWQDIQANLYKVVTQLSYVDTYVFIVNHFDTTNLWLGRSYLDLVVAPIPSTMYPDKPPVDDGVYIRSLEHGMTVAPGMPYRLLFQSSTPPETLGLSYLNFWWPGVIIGMYLLGTVYKAAYAYMARSSYSLHSIYVYASIMLGFQFTNLRIVNFAEAVATSTIALGLLLGFQSMPRTTRVVSAGVRGQLPVAG